MRYPAYSEYKESGVQWLGQVPGHWDAVSLKWISQRYAGGTPDKSNDAYWEDGDIPWLNSGSVNDGYITEPSAFITREGFANSSAKWIPENSLVMALAGQGKTKGMVAQLGIPATCNQSMAAIIPKKKFTPRFLYWWLVSNYQNIRNMAGGEQRDGLNLDMLGSIPCPLLPLSEQTAIADFLDRKTGRIDTLVAKKRRLIALLKEKRAALISRTVTRGLPADVAREFGLEPHTRFKDSGIEWLGELPEGWEPTPLKFIAGIQTGYAFSSDDFTDEGIPVLRIGDITRDGCVDFTNAKYLPETYMIAYSKVLITRGAIVMAMTGATIGKAGKYDLDDPALLNQRVCSFYSTGDNDQSFLWYLLNADFYLEHIKLTAFGGAQPNISDTELLGCIVAVAPATEQTAIATYLDRETAKIDKLVEKVEVAISRLQEYRTALITAAVTGKINVSTEYTESTEGGKQ